MLFRNEIYIILLKQNFVEAKQYNPAKENKMYVDGKKLCDILVNGQH